MRAFPEPALCADDVRCLASAVKAQAGPLRLRGARGELRCVDRIGRRRSKGPLRLLALPVLAGLAFGAALPQAALAPASAHDRAPVRADMAVRTGTPWDGVALPVESPATTALIADDLAELTAPVELARLSDLIAPPDASALTRATDDPDLQPRDPAQVLRFGAVSIPRWLVETILRAASETEADPVYLMALADKESSFALEAKAATSSAEGLFQFLSQTWLELVRSFGPKHGLAVEAAAIEAKGGQLTIADPELRERVLGLRRAPYTAALMAGEMMRRDRARVEQRLGRELKRSECYLAHFLGAASAGRFMELADGKPKQSAAATFRAAAQANRSLFFARAGRKLRGLTVAEVYARLDDMIDRRLDRFRAVAGTARPVDVVSNAPLGGAESALSLLR